MLPERIGIAHFVPAAQQTCSGPLTQHERLFGQQPAFPQQREVRRSQHFVPHSSSFRPQRLQRPVRSLAQRHRGGQQVLRPHHARFGGQRSSQVTVDAVPTRIERHSWFGLQQKRPQPRSPCLQQSLSRGFAQNSSLPQQALGSPQVLMHGQLTSPGRPQRVPGGHATAPLLNPSEPFRQQHVEPETPQVSKQPAYGPLFLSFLQRHGTGVTPEQLFSQNAFATLDARTPLDTFVAFTARVPAAARGVRNAPGTPTLTSATPKALTARERGIGRASARARSSKSSLTRPPRARVDAGSPALGAKPGNP